MKIKLSDLKPNPFKKDINNGKLNEETVKKIQSNMKELGLMGSLPIFKKNDKYFLIAGHHRVEALKRQFGEDFKIEVLVHNYSEENVLRGMVIENLTQRNSEFLEEKENLLLIRNFLKKHGVAVHPMNNQNPRPQNQPETGSIRNIYSWLNKNGEVMALGKISQTLSIADNLDKSLQEQVTHTHGLTLKEKEKALATRVAGILSSIEDKDEQKILAKRLKETRFDAINKEEIVRRYKNSPEEVKEQIKDGSVNLENIDLALTQYNLKDSKKGKIQVHDINKKINDLLYNLSFTISDTKGNIKGVIQDLVILSRYVSDMKETQKAKLDLQLERLELVLDKAGELIKGVRKRI